jgi:hypothetical protein
MSRWFRHYAGMMRDDKLVSVAIRSKQPVERVVWVWGAILESAAEIDDDGLFSLDAAEVAYFLRTDEADIRAVVDGLADAKRLDSNRVVNWGSRQFKSDRSAERQAKYRDSKRGKDGGSDNEQASPNGIVTSLSRHGDAPETETELDTEKKEERKQDAPARDVSDFKAELSELDADRLTALIKHRRSKRGQVTGHAAKLFRSAAEECGLSLSQAVDTCIDRNWITIKPDWLNKPQARGSPPQKQPNLSELFAFKDRMGRNDADYQGPQSEPAIRYLPSAGRG